MKRFLKWLGIGCLVLVLLFFVALPVCAQLGMVGWFARVVSNLAWKQTESLLRSKGEKLTFEELVAPPPEDDANFFAAPLWLVSHSLCSTPNPFFLGVGSATAFSRG
jgi:hypothetical protein